MVWFSQDNKPYHWNVTKKKTDNPVAPVTTRMHQNQVKPVQNNRTSGTVSIKNGHSRPFSLPVESYETPVAPEMPVTPKTPGPSCVPVSLKFCRHLSYNFTSHPNLLGHRGTRGYERLIDAAK